MLGLLLSLGIGAGGKGRPVSTQVAQFLARVQTQSPSYQVAISALINGLVSDGLYATGDACHIVRAHDPITARTNIFSSSYGLSEVNSPAFAPDVGYTGAAAKYLTGHNPSTAGGNFSQNSLSMGAWMTAAGATVLLGLCGIGNGSTGHPYINPRTSTTMFWNDGADLSLAVPSPIAGFYLLCRTASNAIALYKDGSQIATASTASSSLFNAVARFLDDGYNDFSTATLALTWIGGGLTSAQALKLYNRFAAFMAAAPTAFSATYDFFDDFSGPDMQMNLNRYPIFGNNPYTLSGAAIVADPTSVRAGQGKYYHTANNGSSYAIVQLTGTPTEVGGVFESTSSTFSPTIAIPKDYANHGFSAMWHASLNAGLGTFSPSYWNDTWNGAPGTQVNVQPASSGQDHTFSLSPNTRYRYKVIFSGTTVTYTIYGPDGSLLATGTSTDASTPSVVGPWVFFEMGDTSTIWHEAYAKL